MHKPAAELLRLLTLGLPVVWLIVRSVCGSTPRDSGACMAITRERIVGTIGGGHLEYKAIEYARAMFDDEQQTAHERDFPLGPSLGQCCGGSVGVLFIKLASSDQDWLQSMAMAEHRGGQYKQNVMLDDGRSLSLAWNFIPWNIWVFGAGHVGQAVVNVLATLPCRIVWVDSREALLLNRERQGLTVIESDLPAQEVSAIPTGADVLVLTHSHALDFEICLALLRHTNLSYIGLIGSETKAVTFRRRLKARGIAGADIVRINCPIGVPGFVAGNNSKYPGVIAVSVVADLVQRRAWREQQAWVSVESHIVEDMSERSVANTAITA